MKCMKDINETIGELSLFLEDLKQDIDNGTNNTISFKRLYQDTVCRLLYFKSIGLEFEPYADELIEKLSDLSIMLKQEINSGNKGLYITRLYQDTLYKVIYYSNKFKIDETPSLLDIILQEDLAEEYKTKNKKR